jgi:glucose/arabinose dehydrogenase/PKD repeat protein
MRVRLLIQPIIALLTVAAALMIPAPTPVALGATLPANFVETLVAANPTIAFPTSITITPDKRMLVTIHSGSLRVFDIAQNFKSLGEAINLAAKLCGNSERGLLGVALDPNFANNKYIYVYYTFKKGSDCPTNQTRQQGVVYPVNRVSRFTLDSNGANKINSATEQILIDNIPSLNGNHNGGDLHFGADGNLYISVGDGGCDYYDPSGCAENNNAARDRHTLLGKILRITPDGGIPADNPFTGNGTARCNVTGGTTSGTICQETFAWGLRNPFRIAFKPGTSEFYINDVGQRTWEEIDIGVKGADYGWNARDGFCAKSSPTSLSDCRTTPNATVNDQRDPLVVYPHPGVEPDGYQGLTGISLTGGAFVPAGSGWPADYVGDYLFADYDGWIGRIDFKPDGGSEVKPFASGFGSVVEMQFGPLPSGKTALFFSTYENKGEVRAISFNGSGENLPPSAALSASPTSGRAPLKVTFSAQGSSDPNSGDTLSYSWSFGDASAPLTTTAATAVHTYTQPGTFTATLTVRDQKGAASQPATVRVDVDNLPPTPTILAPAPGATYTVGEQIVLEGSASDPEDGALAGDRLTWQVTLHHDTHTHPWLRETIGQTVTIVGPAPEDLLAPTNSYLELSLTATDSRGLTSVITRELRPQLVDIRFESEPPGAQLIVSGVTITTPYTLVAVPGQELTISAPRQTGPDDSTLVFERWSQGGSASQFLTASSDDMQVEAIFRAPSSSPEPVAFIPLILAP